MEIIVSGVDLWKLCCEDFMYSNLQKHHLKMPDLSSTYGTFILRLFVMVILSSSERTVLTMLVVWEQLLMGDFTCSYTDLLISTFNVFQTEHKQLQFNMHMLSTWPTMCSCAYSYSNLEPRLGQYQNSNSCSYSNLDPRRLGQYQNNNSWNYSILEPRMMGHKRTITPVAIATWSRDWDNIRTITPVTIAYPDYMTCLHVQVSIVWPATKVITRIKNKDM